MNLNLLEDKQIFLIIGSMGSGKTTFANNLKTYLDTNIEIEDDFLYFKSNDMPKKVLNTMNKMAMMRHTNNKMALCIYHSTWNNRFYRVINNPHSSISKTFAIIYTSAEVNQLYNSPIKIPSNLIDKFRKQYVLCIEHKRKTRPYLVVTRYDGFRIGRYKNE